MILDKNFREFIELLNEHKVQYLVIEVMRSMPTAILGTRRILTSGYGSPQKTFNKSFKSSKRLVLAA